MEGFVGGLGVIERLVTSAACQILGVVQRLRDLLAGDIGRDGHQGARVFGLLINFGAPKFEKPALERARTVAGETTPAAGPP